MERWSGTGHTPWQHGFLTSVVFSRSVRSDSMTQCLPPRLWESQRVGPATFKSLALAPETRSVQTFSRAFTWGAKQTPQSSAWEKHRLVAFFGGFPGGDFFWENHPCWGWEAPISKEVSGSFNVKFSHVKQWSMESGHLSGVETWRLCQPWTWYTWAMASCRHITLNLVAQKAIT